MLDVGVQVLRFLGRLVTAARGEQATGRPIRVPNVLASLYRVLGIDTAETFTDYNGRPQYVLDEREPVSGLL